MLSLQIEAAQIIWNLLEGSQFATTNEMEVGIHEDQGSLRQDRYSLRCAPQFLGPQIEDIIAAFETITQECNSSMSICLLLLPERVFLKFLTATDNPLVDGETGKIHHGGNFQAMAVTNSMEKTRIALHHVGKLLFAQCTELLNPALNRGLTPSLASTVCGKMSLSTWLYLFNSTGSVIEFLCERFRHRDGCICFGAWILG